MDTVLVIGFVFIIGGGALTAWHLSHMSNTKGKTLLSYRIVMALLGGLCISIGANLIATNIHERFDN